jgi:D-alanyl-D-alanine carboxypeptidase
VLLLAGGGYGGYRYYQLNQNHIQLTATQEQTQHTLQSTQETLSQTKNETDALSEALYSEQQKNKKFEEQIQQIEGVVGRLDKLSKIDPELLQKYSKVFFLNENYAPEKLSLIPKEYRFNKDKDLSLQYQVGPFLEDMLDAAHRADIDLEVVSAYRSFNEQAGIKDGYTFLYGSGANTFSADQGYSEHQLGSTIDVTTNQEPGLLTTGFADTDAYQWLEDNAYKYGFTLSYPEDNEYYRFEPWHWRFVGIQLATNLYEQGDHFYDWDQRDIDEYLISVFDEE